jgi:hypothetical protein
MATGSLGGIPAWFAQPVTRSIKSSGSSVGDVIRSARPPIVLMTVVVAPGESPPRLLFRHVGRTRECRRPQSPRSSASHPYSSPPAARRSPTA